MTSYQPSVMLSFTQACPARSSQRRLILLFRVFIVVMSFMCASWAARAAVGGRISGTIADSSGAVVAGAEITAVNGATGVFGTRSDSKGFYSLPGHADWAL